MSAEASEENLVPAQFDTVILGIYIKGPHHSTGEEAELLARHHAHLRHLNDLYKTGKLIAAGPTPDSPEGYIRGVSLFYNTTLDEVKRFMEVDPQVIAGHFTYQVMTWYMPQGKLELPKA
jgi:uncharacterized protein YciI